MLRKAALASLVSIALAACSSHYVWKKADGTLANAEDIAECHQASRRNATNRELAAPVEISSTGVIQPIQHTSQNSFMTSQIYQQCLVNKGYQQVSTNTPTAP